MDVLSIFLQIILISFVELFYLFGIVIVVGIILGMFERYSTTFIFRALGSRGVLVTAWIGVPIHEIGHLIQCYIWGHKVTKVKLLQFNRPDGVLGYVEHRYNTKSLYQQIGNFFIGLGPIFSGIGSLILGMYIFVPESFMMFTSYIQQNVSTDNLDLHTLVGVVLALVKSLLTVENLMNPLFWIYLWMAISISSHMALSKSDIKGATKGLLVIYFMLVLINLVAEMFQIDSFRIIGKVTKYNAYVLAFFSISLLFSSITLVVSYSLYQLKRRLG